MQEDRSSSVHVAVGVIKDQASKVLIAKRADHLHQGGRWEFPGGKVETQETIQQALTREMKEELGVTVTKMSPLIKTHYNYTDKSVLLDVWCIESFEGEVAGKEGQPIKWVEIDTLNPEHFPAANIPIIHALQLPDIYLITGNFETIRDCIERIRINLEKGIRLIQLRARNLSDYEYRTLAEHAYRTCNAYGAKLMLNTSIDLAEKFDGHGVHLTSKRLLNCNKQTLDRFKKKNKWTAASVHHLAELRHAHEIGIDFVAVSPVLTTQTHPNTEPLGWDSLEYLIDEAACPVYALGGMTHDHLQNTKERGAQGIAVISAFW